MSQAWTQAFMGEGFFQSKLLEFTIFITEVTCSFTYASVQLARNVGQETLDVGLTDVNMIFKLRFLQFRGITVHHRGVLGEEAAQTFSTVPHNIAPTVLTSRLRLKEQEGEARHGKRGHLGSFPRKSQLHTLLVHSCKSPEEGVQQRGTARWVLACQSSLGKGSLARRWSHRKRAKS